MISSGSGEDDSGFRSISDGGENVKINEGTVDSAYFSSESQAEQEGEFSDQGKRKRN